MNEWINNIVDGMEIRKDESVLLHIFGERETNIVPTLEQEIIKKGGLVSTVYRSRSEILERYQGNYIPNYEAYDLCETAIDVFFYGIGPDPEFPKDKIDDYRTEMMTIVKKLISKEKYIQLRLPTEENAMTVGLPVELYKEMSLKAMAIDYLALKEAASKKVEELKDVKNILIQTKGCELQLNIEGRSWYKDDGLGDYPSGEVYIAPNESSANGSVFVSKLIVEGEVFEDFVLKFKEGTLIACSAENLFDYIKSAPGDALKIAEFGIGLNTNIDTLTGYALFDEKAIGTVHIAVGMNHAFGGLNHTPLHLDFVLDAEIIYNM